MARYRCCRRCGTDFCQPCEGVEYCINCVHEPKEEKMGSRCGICGKNIGDVLKLCVECAKARMANEMNLYTLTYITNAGTGNSIIAAANSSTAALYNKS